MITKEQLKSYKSYKGLDPLPDDFDAFWDEQIQKLTIPTDYQLLKKEVGLSSVDCFELRFQREDGANIYSKMVLPKSENKIPIIFHFHGYMGRGFDWSDMLSFTTAGYGMISMDVRGQSGFSSQGEKVYRGNTVKGHIVRGIMDGPENLYFKDVYLDIYTLIEIVSKLPFVDTDNLSSHGESQGGAQALVAAALHPKIKKTAVVYPYLSDFRKVLEFGNTSEAYDELFRHFKFHDPFHKTEEQILRNLDYIDIKNMAHRIKGEVILFTGLEDIVCHPITQFAIYNNLNCPKKHYLLPEYGHEDMHVYVHDYIFNWLCQTSFDCHSYFFEID